VGKTHSLGMKGTLVKGKQIMYGIGGAYVTYLPYFTVVPYLENLNVRRGENLTFPLGKET